MPQLPRAVRTADRARTGSAQAHPSGEQRALPAGGGDGGWAVSSLPRAEPHEATSAARAPFVRGAVDGASAWPGAKLRPLALPTEHGGWGFLLEPLVLAMIVAPSWIGALICAA